MPATPTPGGTPPRREPPAGSPGSYRQRYRRKPDADRGAPVRLATVARTLVLGSLALGAALLYLVRELGADPEELLDYARQAGTVPGGGIAVGCPVVVLRRLPGRRGSGGPGGDPGVSAAATRDDPDADGTTGRSPD